MDRHASKVIATSSGDAEHNGMTNLGSEYLGLFALCGRRCVQRKLEMTS